MPNLVTIRNYADNQILFKIHLDQFLDSIEDWANNIKLDSVNIQNGGISTDNLADLSVTAAKISSSAVTVIKLASETSEKLVPSGTLLIYGGASAPTGYLLCDGSQISRTVYGSLFTTIKTAFGSGDGSTTFHLPDMRGRFPRGRDGGTARDPDAASRTAMNSGGATGDNVGSIQSQGVAPLKVSITGGDGNTSVPLTAGNSWSTTANGQQLHSTGTGSLSTSTNYVKSSAADNTESRPINAYFNYIIKT